jgi:hypothetical protein
VAAQKIFAAPNILTAAILLVLYRKELQYEGCHYAFDCDQYQFWFLDKHGVGPGFAAQLRSKSDNLVPARAFQRALHRLHLDFRTEQRRVGNPRSLEVSNGGGDRGR